MISFVVRFNNSENRFSYFYFLIFNIGQNFFLRITHLNHQQIGRPHFSCGIIPSCRSRQHKFCVIMQAYPKIEYVALSQYLDDAGSFSQLAGHPNICFYCF